jgi:hypothetical protein
MKGRQQTDEQQAAMLHRIKILINRHLPPNSPLFTDYCYRGDNLSVYICYVQITNYSELKENN